VTLPANTPDPRLRVAGAVVVGGVVGASLRWFIGEAMGAESPEWPTLLVNVVGSLLLGWVASALIDANRRGVRNHLPLAAAGSGFCGSFTTFSTFSVIVANHVRAGDHANAAIYVALTVALGLSAAQLGRTLHQRHLGSQARAAGDAS